MRWLTTFTIVVAMLTGPALGQAPTSPTVPPPPASRMTLTAAAWADGGDIPLKFTRVRDTWVSPALTWSGVPARTASFVLIVRDADGVLERGTDDILHWLVWNIPGTATGLPEGVPEGPELPDGTRQTSLRGPMYRGPGGNPESPRHHYIFQLFALDTTVDVRHSENPIDTRNAIFKAMEGHVNAKAVYVGQFRMPAPER